MSGQVNSELEQVFQQEMLEITNNAYLGFNWGNYQDYLRDFLRTAKGATSVHYRRGIDNRSIEIGITFRDDLAWMTIRAPYVSDYAIDSFKKYQETELEVLSKPLPQKLQEVLLSQE